MKQSKNNANYAPASKTNHCDTCEYWRDGACAKVMGAINAKGTCQLFEKKDGKDTGKGRGR